MGIILSVGVSGCHLHHFCLHHPVVQIIAAGDAEKCGHCTREELGVDLEDTQTAAMAPRWRNAAAPGWLCHQ